MTACNIIKSLNKRGNVVVGAGFFSVVLESRTHADRVIKIGHNTEDKWLDFYNIVLKPLQGNPCVPEVHSLYLDKANGYYVCVMEKLSRPSVHGTAAYDTASLCKDFCSFFIDESEFAKQAKKLYTLQEVVYPMLDVLTVIREYTEINRSAGTYCYNNSETAEGRTLDLHVNNIMYREDSAVIIDPWCGGILNEDTNLSVWVSENNLTTGR